MKRLRPADLRRLRDTVLRAVSLVVTDRRWAAPLSAMALGFGLFLGVAIGPGAAGSLATGAGQVIAVASPAEEEPEAGGAGGTRQPAAEPEFEPAEPEAFEPAPLEPEYAPEPIDEAPAEEEAPSEPPSEEEPEEAAETQALKGTVVHANPGAGSYTLAIAGGELVSVHAPKLPLPGAKLAVAGTPLANNTFAEAGRELAGTTKTAKLRGVVTHVDADPLDPAYTLSGRGSSIRVHVPAAPTPQLPALGAYATVAVAIDRPPVAPPAAPAPAPEEPAGAPACAADPTLKAPPPPSRIVVQRRLETEPEPATYLDLAGIVSAVCPGQLLLSADDLRASEADLLLTVPAAIGTSKLESGQSVVATATVADDGSLTLSGLASDEGRKGAEDAALAQGDLKR